MEPLGTIISSSANESDHLISARQINQTRIAKADSAHKTVADRETEISPWTSKGVPSEKIDHIARALLNYVRSVQRDLSIEVHRGTGKIMVQVISKTDGKVIREIPPEELLDLAAKMEEVVGVIFSKNA
jgi:flagellar protein FlaG